MPRRVSAEVSAETIADTTGALLRSLIRERFSGRIALVSSFGAESAVLLHMVAAIDRTVPVIFLETGTPPAEARSYRKSLTTRLRLTRVRQARPDPVALAAADPDRSRDLGAVAPLARALARFDAWISARKHFHGGDRGALETVELGTDWRIRINPLAHWTRGDINAYLVRHDLPAHPVPQAGTRPAARRDGFDETGFGLHLTPAFARKIDA